MALLTNFVPRNIQRSKSFRTFVSSTAIALWGLALLNLLVLNERARSLDVFEESTQDKLTVELDRCRAMAAGGGPQELVLYLCAQGRRPYEMRLQDIASRQRDVNRLRVASMVILAAIPILGLAVLSATRTQTNRPQNRSH